MAGAESGEHAQREHRAGLSREASYFWFAKARGAQAEKGGKVRRDQIIGTVFKKPWRLNGRAGRPAFLSPGKNPSCRAEIVPHNQAVIRWLISVSVALCAFWATAADTRLSSNEVAQVIAQAISRAEQISPQATIAVVDREGFVLGVWTVSGA